MRPFQTLRAAECAAAVCDWREHNKSVTRPSHWEDRTDQTLMLQASRTARSRRRAS